MSNNGAIIVSNVFVGGFGAENGTNLPHEVINFFKPDNFEELENKYYLFLPPYGTISNDKNSLGERVLKDGIRAIIFVRTTENGLLEILGKAEGEVVYGIAGAKREKKIVSVDNEEYKNNIQQIKYGNVSLKQIFEANGESAAYYSSTAKEVLIPNQTAYIKLGKNVTGVDNVFEVRAGDIQRLNSSSMKAYVFPDNQYQYEDFKKILNSSIWETASQPVTFGSYQSINDDNIIKAIRKQDDEVIYSNMLYYLFSNHKDLLQSFIADVLKLDIQLGEKYEVLREENRVDLCIKSKDFCIILENKIKSGINGIKLYDKNKEEDEQITKEDKTLYKEVNLAFKSGVLVYKDNNQAKIVSQLSKYYVLTKKGDKEKGIDGYNEEQIHCFIIKPDYHTLNLDRYYSGDKYTQINYSAVYNCFAMFQPDKNANDYPYLAEFIKALYKHTQDADNEFRNEMLKRMDKVISSKK